jgi:aspartokinase/homoserine dehydrogenase 2
MRRILSHPNLKLVLVGDTSGIVSKENAFSREEISSLIKYKASGKRLKDHGGEHEYFDNIWRALDSCDFDAFVDSTDVQTYKLLHKVIERAHIVVSNKIPIADVSYPEYQNLITKSFDEGRTLDFGTTAGAGMRIPEMVRILGCNGIRMITGCLSGTMNYVSQRINDGKPLSQALEEAMEPPRCYTEPDPRIDLMGADFLRKLVIIGRICGKRIEDYMVKVQDIVPKELQKTPLRKFLAELPTLDASIRTKIVEAKKNKKKLWYLGTADLSNEEYKIGFEEVSETDPITEARESDNVIKIYPKQWRRPVTIIGPGAGPIETATGLLSGLVSISSARAGF